MNKELFEKHVAELEKLRKLFEVQPDEYRFKLAGKYLALGFFCHKNLMLDDAVHFLTQSLDHYRVLRKDDKKFDKNIAFICHNLATAITRNGGSIDTAEKLYLEAFEIYTVLADESPEIYRECVAATATRLSVLYLQKSRKFGNLANKMSKK